MKRLATATQRRGGLLRAKGEGSEQNIETAGDVEGQEQGHDDRADECSQSEEAVGFRPETKPTVEDGHWRGEGIGKGERQPGMFVAGGFDVSEQDGAENEAAQGDRGTQRPTLCPKAEAEANGEAKGSAAAGKLE